MQKCMRQLPRVASQSWSRPCSETSQKRLSPTPRPSIHLCVVPIGPVAIQKKNNPGIDEVYVPLWEGQKEGSSLL